jgi:membrane protease YdiL (CAAX protease family)
MNETNSPSDSNSFSQQPWADRNGFPGWIMGVGWAIGAFALFQIVAAIVSIVILVSIGRLDFSDFDANVITQNLDVLFISNTFGQIVFLGLLTLAFTRLSAPKGQVFSFLRMQSNDSTMKNVGLAFVLLIVIQPIIYYLSWLNLQFPFSESYMEFERAQLELIENYLRGDHLVLLTIFHIGIVPSVCEEILFRGYILRNFERSMNVWVAIVLSGLIFGIFHIRLTQFIPLALLGMLLAWMTIQTRSLWPAVVAHFVNNGGSVTLAYYFPEVVFNEQLQGAMPPLYLVGLSVILTYFVIVTIQRVNSQPGGGGNYVQGAET